MQSFNPTIVLRHRKENLKKCSLQGLELRPDFQFYSYPVSKPLPSFHNYLLLSFEGEPLTQNDQALGLFILDGTWKYAKKMEDYLNRENIVLEKRSLPSHFITAYPRSQMDCADPTRGLASIEAIYIAYHLLGRSTEGLLDRYYWREKFLQLNSRY